MFAWDFLPRDDSAGYAMLTSSGTATPALTAMGAYFASGATNVAGTGFVPMDSRPVAYEGNWADQHLNRRTFRFTSEVDAKATLTFRGTGVIAVFRHSPQEKLIHVSIDGKPVDGWPTAGDASELDLFSYQAVDLPIELASGLDDGVHQLEVTLVEGQLTLGGIIVTREVPFMWPVITLLIAGGLLIVYSLREVVYVTALRSGWLQRRSGVSLRPPLPILPDWQPARRA
jgi:hypothetical protein